MPPGNRTTPGSSGSSPTSGAVKYVAFSPDGKTVLTASSDRTGRLWDAGHGSPIGLPLMHDGPRLVRRCSAPTVSLP